jgi:hypothetical protein
VTDDIDSFFDMFFFVGISVHIELTAHSPISQLLRRESADHPLMFTIVHGDTIPWLESSAADQ